MSKNPVGGSFLANAEVFSRGGLAQGAAERGLGGVGRPLTKAGSAGTLTLDFSASRTGRSEWPLPVWPRLRALVQRPERGPLPWRPGGRLEGILEVQLGLGVEGSRRGEGKPHGCWSRSCLPNPLCLP